GECTYPEQPGPVGGLVAAGPRLGRRVEHRGAVAPGGRAVPLAPWSWPTNSRRRRTDRSLDGHRRRHSRSARGGGGAAGERAALSAERSVLGGSAEAEPY